MITGLVIGTLGALVAGFITGILELPVWAGGVSGGIVAVLSSLACQFIGLP